MRMIVAPLAAFTAAACIAAPAAAEIVERRDAGFVLAFETPTPATTEAVFAAVGRPAGWWSDAHTYSGSAANITVDLRPGGCWCEALPGGGVKHGEVLLAWPERGLVRFAAPFGPLQDLGADAILTISWADAENGEGRRLRWSFRVSGPGAGAMAEPVHAVMGEQFDRLTAYLAAHAE